MSACRKHLALADKARTISGGDDTLADSIRYAEAAFLFSLSGWAGSIPGEEASSEAGAAPRGSDQASQLIDLLAQRCAETLGRALASNKSVAIMPPTGSTLVAAALQIAELLALAGCHLPASGNGSRSAGGSGSMEACEQVERLLWRSGTIDGKRGIIDPALAARPLLHDPGPLRRLWQHSASQHKRVVPLVAASGKAKIVPPRGPDSRPWRFGGEYGDGGLSGGGAGRAAPGHQMAPRPHMLFSDPTLPLILDVGCGFGVSILGLAVAPSTAFDPTAGDGKSSGKEGSAAPMAPLLKALADGRVNYLGCDLSGHAIGYAASIAHRWKLSMPVATETPDPYAPSSLPLAAQERPSYVRGAGECAFVVTDALSAARWATAVYPGALAGVLVQFPTPYKLRSPTSDGEGMKETGDDGGHSKKKSGKGKADTGNEVDKDETNEGMSKNVKSEAAARPLKKSKLERAERRKNLQRAFQDNDDSEVTQSNPKGQGGEVASPRDRVSQGVDTPHPSKGQQKAEKPVKRREAGPSGNVQLPSSHDDSTFMVSSELMTCAVAGLAPGGCLLVQSNVEDVAVTMAALVASADCPNEKESHLKKAKKEKKARAIDDKTDANMEGKLHSLSISDISACPASRAHATSAQGSPPTASTCLKAPRGGERAEVPLRQRLWATLGGQRAVGPEWLPFNPLSRHARTETESVYDEDRKPVHRRVWVAKGKAAF